MRMTTGRRRKKALRPRGGETIVEVAVSAVVFLLLMAVLQSAVTFSTAALDKNKRQRADHAEMMEALQTATAEPSTQMYKYTFYAYDATETIKGHEVFDITVSATTKKASFTDTQGLARTVTFSVFD